ncbi:hypothetical protein [Actinoplanes sp. NPDC049802]|uniref:hypothetical protein n=1 Tax=Actinoplanes sp. NPDC049802 TaxID=3154742 RepID=UPI0033F019D3
MYARIQTIASRPDNADKLARELVEIISGHPGYAGLVLLESALLTLWTTRQDAEFASQRSQAGRGPRPVTLLTDDSYEVEEDQPGPAAHRPATDGWIGFFDGPLRPDRLAAIRRAGAEQIGPALRAVPGLVRTLTMWDPGTAKFAVAHLTDSPGSLREVGETITSTRPLTGDAPAAVSGPDRIATDRVVAYEPV